MDKAQELLYAVVGAGDFAVQKARDARKLADRKTTQKYYKEFVKRGRALSTKMGTSAPAKRAKAARTQVKSAATGVTNAVRGETKTSRSGTSKSTASKTARAS